MLFQISISVRYSYQLDASTTLQCGKSISFCVVDNEITTNSIYYTTIPSNDDAHRIQTTNFLFSIENIQSNCVAALFCTEVSAHSNTFHCPILAKAYDIHVQNTRNFYSCWPLFQCLVSPFCFLYLSCPLCQLRSFLSIVHLLLLLLLPLLLLFFHFCFDFDCEILLRTNAQTLLNFVLFFLCANCKATVYQSALRG